jgi:TRAP-type C4-dicarboxylate transport system substrate-binding protein
MAAFNIVGLAGAAALLATTLAAGVPAANAADDVKTLRFHTWGPPKGVETGLIFEPLVADIEKNSHGKLKVQIYFSMALGGKARDLVDQALNGVVDISYTLPGYHPGRFTILEGIELPFVGGSAEMMSKVAWDWATNQAKSEFDGLKLLSINAIDPGFVHTTKTPVRKMEDMKGLKIRVAGRYIGMAVEALGGVPVQMPLTDVYESLARGQTQGMMIPWIIMETFKLNDVAKYHTEIPMYNSTLIIMMNKKSYESLTPEQKAGIDLSTGPKFGAIYGKRWDDNSKFSRDAAIKKGHEIIKLEPAEEARWREASKTVYDEWLDAMNKKGLDGRKMFNELRALVQKYKGGA